jgi:hypothetical protein
MAYYANLLRHAMHVKLTKHTKISPEQYMSIPFALYATNMPVASPEHLLVMHLDTKKVVAQLPRDPNL